MYIFPYAVSLADPVEIPARERVGVRAGLCVAGKYADCDCGASRDCDGAACVPGVNNQHPSEVMCGGRQRGRGGEGRE